LCSTKQKLLRCTSPDKKTSPLLSAQQTM